MFLLSFSESNFSIYREKEFKLDIYKYKYMRDNNDNGVVMIIYTYTQHTNEKKTIKFIFFML